MSSWPVSPTNAITGRVSIVFDEASRKRVAHALRVLPARFVSRSLRVGMNAWGGVVKDRAVTLARRRTGLLAKSLIVKKPVIPDTSYNAKHHGKPAYVLVGPSRKTVKFIQAFNGGFRTRTVKQLAKTGYRGNLIQKSPAKPSRYAHLVEHGHGGKRPATAYPFMGPATRLGATAGMEKMRSKLETELTRSVAAVGGK